jgi:hypothetical protein
MIITRKHLSRRTLLRGIGASIGLPLLESMTPAFASPASKPMRLGFVYVPNGIVMDNWTPKSTGANFEFTPILKALEPFRDQTLVISKLMNHQANALGDGGGDHARAGASFLTGAHPKKTGGADIHAGVSVDQVAAASMGAKTRLASLELGVDDNRVVGHCDSGYSCAYTNSISWKSPSTPLPPEANPRLVFERLFGDEDPTLDAATRLRRARYRKSLLDSTRDETSRLSGSIATADRHKIGEYLESIRDIERRIQNAEKDVREVQPTIEKPSGIPAGYDEHTRLLFDLQWLAFKADLTRVSTMVLGREGSVRTYGEIGVPEPHHPLSHHRNSSEALAKLTRINAFHVSLFANFIQRLAETREDDGTLLDQSLIVYGCGIADSNRHTHEDLPVAVLGGGSKSVRSGRHLVLSSNTPVTNLYLALLQRAGAPVEHLGDSTGILDI